MTMQNDLTPREQDLCDRARKLPARAVKLPILADRHGAGVEWVLVHPSSRKNEGPMTLDDLDWVISHHEAYAEICDDAEQAGLDEDVEDLRLKLYQPEEYEKLLTKRAEIEATFPM